MPATLEILQPRVMSPSKEERSCLLERLVASLDVHAEVEPDDRPHFNAGDKSTRKPDIHRALKLAAEFGGDL